MTLWYAIVSGLCASFASMFGKLSGLDFVEFDDKLRYLIKVLFFCGMLFLNSLVWTFFVKALHQSKTTVEATAVSSAINYVFSGLLGYLIFGEVLSLLWWLGVTLIVLGITIMTDEEKCQTQIHKR